MSGYEMRIIFLRHGETKVNLAGGTHITGDSSGLTEKGISQIMRAIPFLKKNNVTKVYSSPEKRALQSAKLVSRKLGVQVEVLDGLRERNWGDWEGRHWDEIVSVLEKMNLEERYKFTPPNGESWQQMEKRLKASLKLITSRPENSCVVTHMGALRGLMPILTGEELSTSLKYEFENGSLTVFDFGENKFKEVLVNYKVRD